MARVVVNVMPKAEILDPQVDDSVSAEDLDKVAATLLANTVIEDYEVVGLEVK